MTEAEWAASREPRQLLDYHRMKREPRRLRLLAAACVRSVVPADAPAVVAEALETVERYADGRVARAQFLAARKAVRRAAAAHPAVSLLRTLTGDAMEGMTVTVANARSLAGPEGGAVVCGLIRCVFGNPYRHTAFDPAWRTEAAVALARGVLEERAFDRLPVLADALEDAGCADPDVLAHCRGAGPHARGCWVIDGLLGR
jgi:hypothetical protein